MRRGSFARAGGRVWGAARYGWEGDASISQIQPVLRPRSSATRERVYPRAPPRLTERLSSRAISFSTESSWLRRSKSSLCRMLLRGSDIVSLIFRLWCPKESISAGFARRRVPAKLGRRWQRKRSVRRSEEHTSELQSRQYLVCRLLLEKKKKQHAETIDVR